MEAWMDLLSASLSGLVSVVLMAAVLHPRVHDGVICKFGLVTMSLGFGAVALRTIDGAHGWDGIGLSRSVLLISVGLTAVIAGYLARARRSKHPMRRLRGDWIDPRRCSSSVQAKERLDAKP